MRITVSRRRYEPIFGFRQSPESFVSCAVCGWDIPGPAAFWKGLPVHPSCLLNEEDRYADC